ncbi:MAG TPA: Wzz/FepE/Etk N-terminal domain-containing protein [Solirubrobacteraceae bacterium]|nr:Wzz/FepE/Etk N-terminal domain-containing protein [Solirubrobacteraceae bacterium]
MHETTTDAASIFSPIWKRKWLILAVGVIVGVATYLYYKSETPVYTASTEVYLGSVSEQQTTGVGKSASKSSLANQAGLINSGIIGEVVRRRLRGEHDIAALRGKAKAKASGAGEFIVISTRAHSPAAADKLANAYALAFVEHQRAGYRRNLKAQIANETEQLHRIELASVSSSKGKGKRAASTSTTLQAANIASKINALESTLATYTGAQQVSRARSAALLSPKPKKSALFGFVLGLVLASIAAYVLSRFDRRLRRLADLESIFGAQIIAALPAVRSPVVRPDGRRAPAKALLEPLRRLHTTLGLQRMLERHPNGGARTILFLSPDAGDGKSTLVANLARVQSEAEERVAIVEADFRRPVQARLLDVNGPYGLGDVLTGKIGLGEAMQTVRLGTPLGSVGEPGQALGGVSTVTEASSVGSVSVLTGGEVNANPPALLARPEMRDLLQSTAEEFSYVLLDAPPPLEVSDVMPLLPVVDGIVIVARIGHTRDVSAQRLAQLLARSATAPVLGVVANCVPRKDIERYGFTWGTVRSGRRRKLIG